MKTRLSLLLLLFALFASFAGGKAYRGLKVLGKYDTMHLSVAEVPKNALGLTTKEVETTVKLALLKAGIKTEVTRAHGLNIYVNILETGLAASIKIEMIKRSVPYGISRDIAGAEFSPLQENYATLVSPGGDRSNILLSLRHQVERFVVDYLESQLEY